MLKHKQTPTKTVTLRAILLSSLLIPPNCYFSVQTPTPTTVSLVYTVVFNLFLLILLNIPLKRWTPQWAFTQGELLTVYVMLSLATIIAGHDIMQVLASILGHATWFATPENEWDALFSRFLPDWLVVKDKAVLRGHYEGRSTLYTWHTLRTWTTPVFWWSLFLIALMLAMLCVNALMSRQWTEREKLSYPIIQLPLEMTREGGSKAFFTNPLLLVGFCFSGGIVLLNGLHPFIPSLPTIPTRTVDLGPLATQKPLSAIGWTPVCFFPFAIGLSFFMPLELSFSAWFFYWVWKGELVFGAMMGLRNLPGFPYIKPQASGAYFAIALMSLWTARSHLSGISLHLFKMKTTDDSKEPMRYRTASVGLLLSLGFLGAFCLQAGMSAWVIPLFFGFYFALCIAIVRLRAELGAPVNELYNVGPDNVLTNLFGTRTLAPRTLTVFSLLWGINRANRCNPMPHQIEGYKLAEQTGMNVRRLTAGMVVATVLGTAVSFWAWLDVHYRSKEAFGGGFGWEAFERLQGWMFYAPGSDVPAVAFTGVGFGIVVALTFLRRRYMWWPLHPVAYPLASSLNWTASWLWFSIFVSWFAKSLILRHGGFTLYQRSIPFFLGLILGDFVVGGAFNVYSVLTGVYTYTFWH